MHKKLIAADAGNTVLVMKPFTRNQIFETGLSGLVEKIFIFQSSRDTDVLLDIVREITDHGLQLKKIFAIGEDGFIRSLKPVIVGSVQVCQEAVTVLTGISPEGFSAQIMAINESIRTIEQLLDSITEDVAREARVNSAINQANRSLRDGLPA